MEDVKRFKMYKDGKKWVFAGITAFSIGVGMFGVNAVHADVKGANDVITTASSANQNVKTVAGSEAISVKNDNSSVKTNDAQSVAQPEASSADKTAAPVNENSTAVKSADKTADVSNQLYPQNKN